MSHELRSRAENAQGPLQRRVCDQCIRRKVKCDLAKPICSSCARHGHNCIYTSVKRKPGPPRGTPRAGRRIDRSAAGETSQRPVFETSSNLCAQSDSHLLNQADNLQASPNVTDSPATIECPLPNLGAFTSGNSLSPCTPRTENSHDSRGLTGVHIYPFERELLYSTSNQSQTDHRLSTNRRFPRLNKYLSTIDQAIPLFDQTLTGQSPELSDELLLAVVLITAKVTEYKFSSGDVDVDGQIDILLTRRLFEESSDHDAESLSQFRLGCILAFYEFHQFPGRQAWTRITQLTRSAYWEGLDRLDSEKSASAGTHENIDCWRLVWWCIYRLDTYANIASGTPYLIDEGRIKTCLPSKYSSAEQFLPPRPESLWTVMSTITSSPSSASIFNCHMITSTATRQFGRILQLRDIGPTQEMSSQIVEAKKCLSTLQLALPANHTNHGRNAFEGETKSAHHARMVTNLHLLMCRLLGSIISCAIPTSSDEEWLLSWQMILESCQDVVGVAEQWDRAFVLHVDPGVCFVLFTALAFLDLHGKAGVLDVEMSGQSHSHGSAVLLLLLEQFAAVWMLPKLLLLSFKSLTGSVPGPLTRDQIVALLCRFETPLHPQWLRFLTSISSIPTEGGSVEVVSQGPDSREI